MSPLIGIRREDRSVFERRTPISPEGVFRLVESGIDVLVQRSWIRIFSDEEFEQAGATVTEDISGAPVVFGVKEMPVPFFRKDHTYVFFSHTIKGQSHNMPMLKRLKELGCTLIDYEKITDGKGRRLIFFGRYAGIAGMVESIWALGKRLDSMGYHTPFRNIGRPYEYKTVREIKEAVRNLGNELQTHGIPEVLTPFVVGFTGYGNVSKGAQEVFDMLPHKELTAAELLEGGDDLDPTKIYKVVFHENEMVVPKEGDFDLHDYFDHPERYQGRFSDYLEYLPVLMNCIYWDERYPRILTKEYLREHYRKERARPFVVGDISCDIDGSIEITHKPTDPSNPVYMYDPATGRFRDGYNSDGVLVMAVDALPAELPWDSSEEFSKMLMGYVPAIARADYSMDFEHLELPSEIKRAVVLHRGEFTPEFAYMEEFLKGV